MTTPDPLEDRIAKIEKSVQRIERILGLQRIGGVSTDEPDEGGADGGGLSTRSVGCAHSTISLACIEEAMAEV